jgi:hypothetical protein
LNSPDRHYLAPLFEPASVAVIGASKRAGAIGTVLIHNMREAGFQGRLFHHALRGCARRAARGNRAGHRCSGGSTAR